ncbi:hypothetical protein EOK75_17875 (plasmid) [Pseudorhodobacter turbinis]|uniref:Uncharacterized protein n=1 Tax=Pseudorhodobacter turbinis TaxID=2500533 RepID=A0A4V1E1B7_9RHOB|nr:hypothetical protein [Pseudorhodobacter turbinis]QCO57574.1 hypothetical protein EOK75_17875 [Pseudorhodobacter turbinis]
MLLRYNRFLKIRKFAALCDMLATRNTPAAQGALQQRRQPFKALGSHAGGGIMWRIIAVPSEGLSLRGLSPHATMRLNCSVISADFDITYSIKGRIGQN